MIRSAFSLLILLALTAASLPAQDLTLLGASDVQGIVGQPFLYTITTAPATATSFAATGLPVGMTINTSTGLISGTPTAEGSVLAAISATDASGTVSKVLRIDINENGPVVISDPGTQVANSGTTFSEQVTASGNATFFTAVGLPPGLSINQATGFISGVPMSGGTYPVSVIAGSASNQWVTTVTMNVYPMIPVVSVRTLTATVGDQVRLDINPSNQPTSFAATGLPAGLTLDASTGIITGVPTTAATSQVTVTAANAGGAASAIWTLVVNPAGVGSVNLPAPVPVGTIGVPYSAQISATGTPTSYVATGLPAGLSVDSATGAITGTPSAGSGGAALVLVSAVYAGGTVSAAATIEIDPLIPVITSPTTTLVLPDAAFNDGILASNAPTSYGATGLPPGLNLNATTGIISGVTEVPGTYAVLLSAANAGGTGTALITVVVPSLPVVNAKSSTGAPVLASTQVITPTAGVPFAVSVVASNAPTGYAATGLPSGLSINPVTGVISGIAASPGVTLASVSCSNAFGSTSETLSCVVEALPITAFETSLATQQATVGAAFSFQAIATYGPATITALNLPPGLSIASTTGVISGTPTSGGTYVVALTSSNATGAVTQYLTIDVAPAPPVFSYPAYLVGTVGVSHGVTVNGGSGATFSAIGLPGGITIATGTGTLSGSPSTAGTYPFSVTGTNAGGSTTVSGIYIVNPAGGPGISSSLATISVPVNTAVSYTITTSASAPTFAATGLPSGVSLNISSGLISGIPTVGGSYPILLSVTSAAVATQEALIIQVTPYPPVIGSSTLGVFRVGVFGTDNVDASNAPTSWSARGLPPGLSIDPVYGIISGIASSAGSFPVQVTAANAGGADSMTVTLIVNPAGEPTLTSPTTIYTTPHRSFTYQITALNAATGYSATGLPAGVSINSATGVISGATSSLGTVDAVVTATNGTGSRSQVLAIVTVAPGSPGAPPTVGSGSGGCGLGGGAGVLLLMAAAAFRARRRPGV